MTGFEIIYICVLAILVGASIFTAYQTKKLVRDNPKPLIYAFDPKDYEWHEDIQKVEPEMHPQSKYLRVKALLINPGIVPMILERVSEELTAGNSKVEAERRLIQPRIPSSERYGLYVFTDTWVTLHDDFSIWYCIYELKDTTKEDYKLRLTFHFKIGDKKKEETTELSLRAHNS